MLMLRSSGMYKILFQTQILRYNIIPGRLLAAIEYDGQLSVTAYVILAVVLLGIIAGLGWCFYRAITAAGRPVEPQSPDEVGDEK